MIFFNPHLMPNLQTAKLLMVRNPKPFDNNEDHQAGIYIQLHQLLEQAAEEGENPEQLIEDFLELKNLNGKGIEELADNLYYSDQMTSVLWDLQDRWSTLDPNAPDDTSLTTGGIGKKEAMSQFATLTLRSFLETLSSYSNE